MNVNLQGFLTNAAVLLLNYGINKAADKVQGTNTASFVATRTALYSAAESALTTEVEQRIAASSGAVTTANNTAQ